ncbi:hypothetical protein IGI04_023014 [Brassica rapa subsp. trilocularis]|uniref:Reverse transcriptase zinc-binding domain-containing protein n=1 Tax=Brassica rapa subsp. trilocularis TaxID=1813537 RepID=A0ABQ7M6T8_BRACM|nr:hypothetical protein IGI04_023014 [Brassica rapa subsp. trilocularis]
MRLKSRVRRRSRLHGCLCRCILAEEQPDIGEDKISYLVCSGVPRFYFITWLAVLDRLSTGVRMRVWNVEQSCVFCGEKDETRDHMYFACPYMYTVWLRIVGRVLGSSITLDWNDTMTGLQGNTFSAMDYVLIRLAFQVTVYLIWRERNARRH